MLYEIHVIPEDDTGPHGGVPNCPCGPVLEPLEDGGVPIYIHHAWDCREAYEEVHHKGSFAKGWIVYITTDEDDEENGDDGQIPLVPVEPLGAMGEI